jgi:hypothetical protein
MQLIESKIALKAENKRKSEKIKSLRFIFIENLNFVFRCEFFHFKKIELK